LIVLHSIQRNTQSAKELSESTGRTVLACQADVREPKQLQDAVAKTIEKFGRIDFVICGMFQHSSNIFSWHECNQVPLVIFWPLLVIFRRTRSRLLSALMWLVTFLFELECTLTRIHEPAWDLQHGQGHTAACSSVQWHLPSCQRNSALQR
jgi:Enoyl-(Acyl carrier protein) reductase